MSGRKVLPIGSPEAAAVIQRIREQERLRKKLDLDTYGKDTYKSGVKLTPELKEKIKRMLADGMTRKQVARVSGVSYSTIARIDVGLK